MPRVVISNVYSDDNRGGSALTAAAVQAALTIVPGAHVSLITFEPGEESLATSHRHTRRDFLDAELLPSIVSARSGMAGIAAALAYSLLLLAAPGVFGRSHPAVQRIREADLVLGKGGQMFRYRDRRGLVALWLAVLPLLLARRMGRPAVVYGQGFGPFARARTRRLSALIARRMTAVVLRDADSCREAAASGVSTDRIIASPDTVLTLAPPGEAEMQCSVERLELPVGRFAAVTVLDVMSKPVYRANVLVPLVVLIRALLEHDDLDAVVIVVQVDGASVSDAAASAELAAMVDDERVRVLSEDLSWRELVAVYSAARLVVGGRVHSNILSLLGGTPAFPIEFKSEKASRIFDALGARRFVLPLSPSTADDCAALLLRTVDAGPEARSEIVSMVAEQRARALDAVRRVRELSGLPAAPNGLRP